jgi:uncharacterized protein DUF29
MPDGPRYDDDFYAWTQYQAEVLRSLETRDNRFDRENIAEEIETVGRNELDAVRSQVRRIIEHFLKLEHSPATEPRLGWIESILDARSILGDKVTATLRLDVETMLPRLYRDARHKTEVSLRGHGEEAPADQLPEACPYLIDQIFADEWYPSASDQAGESKGTK